MRGGHVDAVSRTQVSGWAADAEQPNARLRLTVMVNGAERGRTVADKPRVDLAKLGRYGDGAHGFAFAFPKPLPAHRDHDITVLYTDDMQPVPGGARRLARDPSVAPPRTAEASPAAPAEGRAAEPGPHPILVTAPGRSGTTYLMSCLAAAPQIVAAELVPYEVRLLSYYATVFGVLTAPADQERSTHPDRLEGDGFHVGSNPFAGAQYAPAFKARAAFEDYTQKWVPRRLSGALANIVREYYRRLAADRGKGEVLYFAEKNNNLHRPSRMFVRRAFPRMREIAIVRDPRDVLCSHMAYFESSEDRALRQLTHACRQLAALHESAGPELCVIRYEDMVRGEPATFERLSSFLGAAVAPVAGDESGAMFRTHATSESPQASIGRWRRDLPATAKAQTAAEWGTFLDTYGYARD
jgi:hypothetical protein